MDAPLKVQTYLVSAGIDAAVAAIYTALVTTGPTTAMRLSKITGISRTQIYRHLETLQSYNLVNVEELSHGKLFWHLPITNLKSFIRQNQINNNQLRVQMNETNNLLQQVAGGFGPHTTTQHYYGRAGLNQAMWNITKSKSTLKILKALDLYQHSDKNMLRLVQEHLQEKAIHTSVLTNSDETRDTYALLPYHTANTHVRQLEPTLFKIHSEIYIYNDIVTLLDYTSNTAQAIEIIQPALYAVMEQTFDAMWQLSKPLPNG